MIYRTLRIIKALFLCYNSQYYVIINLQNHFLSEKIVLRKKIYYKRAFSIQFDMSHQTFVRSNSYSNSISSRRNKYIYNTVYKYYVKL